MIYGIDLGTTFSAIAHVNPLGDPVCIPIGEDGKWSIPSAVLFSEDNKVYVGEEAINNSWMPGSRLVEFAKREMGLQNGITWKYRDWEYTPEEISALILRKIVQQVSNEHNLPPVRDVVVSHPQYFYMPQKDATRVAVELAGLNLVATITEPNAAAVAYGVYNPKDSAEKTVLVFDLGGGTFDVTLMRIEGKSRLQMIGSDGDARLGGMNWDSEIVMLAKEGFQSASDEDFENLASLEEKIMLRIEAERAKILFSKPDKAMHAIWPTAGGNKRRVIITRESFEERCRPLVARCIERCERLLRETGYKWEMIDEILLVGSSTRTPTIQEQVKRVWGAEPQLDKEPKLMVAKGAAMWGHWVSNGTIDARWGETSESKVAGLKIRDNPEVSGCTAHGLGVLVRRGNRDVIKLLIRQNTSTPIEREETFSADTEGATSIHVPLYEGESEEPDKCFLIGHARLDNLPPLTSDQPIKVKFKIDVSGRMEVRVIDVKTGQEDVRQLDRNVLRESDEQPEKDFETRRKHLAELMVI